MYGPLVSSTSSQARGPRPLSRTWVSPAARGVRPRSNVRSESGNDLLQSALRAFLHVVVEGVSVRVDADGQRTEVLDAELPEALRHQLLPHDLLDLLDLRRLERGGAADDREVHHPEPVHRLDCLVGEAALAADRADAVLLPQRLGEAHHARARRRADADLLVLAAVQLANPGGRMQQERAVEVHRRLDSLVEDADLRAVADADDV